MHIAVRYFFIADRVKSKEIRIEYCSRGIMIADYFTKTLQGLIFRQLWDMIMGNTDIALSTDQVSSDTYQTSRIPAVAAQQESRSVLGKKGVIDLSPPSLKILSASDPPASRSTHKSDPPASGPTRKDVCADAHTCTAVCTPAHTCTPRVHEPHAAKATPALSWADEARKENTRNRKELGTPHSFYEI
jgi:hypothetical protein